jgi:hypothetical protein
MGQDNGNHKLANPLPSASTPLRRVACKLLYVLECAMIFRFWPKTPDLGHSADVKKPPSGRRQ